MRNALFVLLCLCGCSSLSSEQRDALAMHQRNAKHYYEGALWSQSMGQIEKGLALAPDDYLLNSLKGAILLKTSASSQGTDHRRLDEATAVLGKVYEQRAANRHEPYLLFDYALALQKQGRRHLGEALRLRGEAAHTADNRALQEAAANEQRQADEQLQEADRLLSILLERGELLRLAQYHRLLIAQDRRAGDREFLEQAGAYLEQMSKEQKVVQEQVNQTKVLGYEKDRRAQLRALEIEEMEVRALLADHYFDRRKFEDALTMLNRVLDIDPQRSVDYYNRGRVLRELGRAAAAKEDFRKFLATTSLPATSDKVTYAAMALDG